MDDNGNPIPQLNESEERIAEAVAKKLASTRFIAPEEHYQQHMWIAAQMKAQAEWTARKGGVVDFIVGGVGIVAVIGAVLWFGAYLLDAMQTFLDKLSAGG